MRSCLGQGPARGLGSTCTMSESGCQRSGEKPTARGAAGEALG